MVQALKAQCSLLHADSVCFLSGGIINYLTLQLYALNNQNGEVKSPLQGMTNWLQCQHKFNKVGSGF